MEYIAKRAVERITAFRTMETADWWAELSPEGQAEYLKEHPDSKKAKEVHEQRKQAQMKRPSVKSHEDAKEKEEHPDMVKHADDHPKNIEHLHPDAQKFFKDGHDKPGSPERKSAAGFFKKKAKQIAKAVKHAAHENVKEWKHGVKGIGKLFTGKKLSEHEKAGVKSIIKDVLITAGVVSIGGGLAHGVMAAMAHMSRDLVAETFFKSVAHGIVEHGSEVASVDSLEATEFMSLVQEVIAEAEAETAAGTGGGKFPPKKDKKKDKKKTPPVKKGKKKADEEDEEEDEEDTDDDEDSEDGSDDESDEDSSDTDGESEDDSPDLDPDTEAAVQKVVDFLSDFAENGNIPKEAWLAAANEEPMEDGKVFPDKDPEESDDEEPEDDSEDSDEEDADEDEDVNDDEDDEEEEGDGSTLEDKVKQKDPDEAPKKPKLKKSKSDDEDDGDDINAADEGNDSE